MSFDLIAEQLRLLPDYLGGHLLLTILALLIGVVICVPLGMLVSRIKPLQWPILTAVGILQTIPGLALLALMVPLLGTIGFVPALLALILYSFLPILRNTVTGILGVDPAVIEAARGIGMTDLQVLRKVQIPLSLPVIVAGIRTSAVWVVGTATLATPVGATSLGNYVFSGLQTQNLNAIMIGCIAAALLAILLDQLIRLIEVAASRRNRRLGFIAALALLALIAAGIGPAAFESYARGDRQEPVVIGSKPFTEQYILARLIADHLVDNGWDEDIRSGMGTMILFEALAGGSVDCYVDYTGTIWTNVMKRQDTLSREDMLQEMTDWLSQEHGIVCIGPLGFENTYSLAVRSGDAAKKRLRTIADLARVSGDLIIGSDYEFFSRPEWVSLKRTYDLNFRQLLTMDPALMYSAIAQNEVDVISAYSTDGRLAAYNLTVLQDNRQAFPPYDAVLLLSSRAAKRSGLSDLLRPLIGTIDDRTMREANKLVDVDGLSVDSAAAILRVLLIDNIY